MSSTTDPASYDRHSDQPTPRRRSDTMSGTPYDLQPKRNHDDLSYISPRRHSATAIAIMFSLRYYLNKSNSSESKAASGALFSPTGSKVVPGRVRKSSDATNCCLVQLLGSLTY